MSSNQEKIETIFLQLDIDLIVFHKMQHPSSVLQTDF